MPTRALFGGEIAVARERTAGSANHGALLLVTGPFTSALGLRSTAGARRLFLLTPSIRLTDDA